MRARGLPRQPAPARLYTRTPACARAACARSARGQAIICVIIRRGRNAHMFSQNSSYNPTLFARFWG